MKKDEATVTQKEMEFWLRVLRNEIRENYKCISLLRANSRAQSKRDYRIGSAM